MEQGVLKIVDAILALAACLRQSPSLPRALHDEYHMSESEESRMNLLGRDIPSSASFLKLPYSFQSH